MELTKEQNQVIDKILQLVRLGQKEIKLGGYAGTGKTTIIKSLLDDLGAWCVCAFTGKAANVLRRKDVPASTIHSLIYVPEEDFLGRTRFVLKDDIIFNGIIVDEASMVSEKLYNDLMSFGVPVIFVGDHGQLEPVGCKFNLMAKEGLDCRLETIHRNAGDIVKFAHWMRQGGRSWEFKPTDGSVHLVRRQDLKMHKLAGFDQIICAFNNSRNRTNRAMREMLSFKDDLPMHGEKIICLKNNHDLGIFNGMQGIVEQVRYFGEPFPEHLISFSSYGEDFHNLVFSPKTFLSEKPAKIMNESRNREICFFDFAYCITCHKAQGDEFDSVLVIEQNCDLWAHERWTYTAATRARKELYWLCA